MKRGVISMELMCGDQKLDIFSMTFYIGISGKIMAQPLLGCRHLFCYGEIR